MRPPTLSWPLVVAAAIAAWATLAVWMLRQPVALPSDDALFFARGLEHFSVLEFSPHFPGYPGFVVLGRALKLLTADATQALFLSSTLCALALPPAGAWVAWRWSGNRLMALAAFATIVTQPLLPALGLEMLSDSSGLLFLLLGLGSLAGPRWFLAGTLLGIAALCRPSYGVMIAAAVLAPAVLDRRRAPALLAGFLLVCALGFGFVLAWEGWPYVDEGLRFLSGHTSQWGNTAFAPTGSPGGWLATTAAHPWLALPVAVGLASLRTGSAAKTATMAAFLAGLAWTLAMQNPDNLRHAAPVAILGGLLAARARPWAGLALSMAQGATLLALTAWTPAQPPLAAAISALNAQPPGTVITNHGVALARRDLARHRVVDAYYTGETAFAENLGGGENLWRLSSTPGGTPATFPPRFAGERALWLRRVKPPAPSQ